MKKLSLGITILILLIAATIFNIKTSSTRNINNISQAGIVVVNEEIYLLTDMPEEGVQSGDLVAVVSNKVNPNVMPKNLESNILEKGAKLYKLEGKDNFLLGIDQFQTLLFKKKIE